MSYQSWIETLTTQQAAGTNFTTYTTAKTVLNTQTLITLGSQFWYVGRMLRITVTGGVSNRVTGPDTTTFQVMMGTISAFSSGAVNYTTTAHTTIPFWLDILVTCQVIGSGTTAKLMGQMRVGGQMFAAAASQADSNATHGHILAPNTAPAQGTGFDSTIANILDFFVAQSNSGSDGIQLSQYLVESLN